MDKKIKEEKRIQELSRDIMMELMDCIYVYEDGKIKIKFAFEDEFRKISKNIDTH